MKLFFPKQHEFRFKTFTTYFVGVGAQCTHGAHRFGKLHSFHPPQTDPHVTRTAFPDGHGCCYFLMGPRWMNVEIEAVQCSSIMNHHLRIHLILYAQVITKALPGARIVARTRSFALLRL